MIRHASVYKKQYFGVSSFLSSIISQGKFGHGDEFLHQLLVFSALSAHVGLLSQPHTFGSPPPAITSIQYFHFTTTVVNCMHKCILFCTHAHTFMHTHKAARCHADNNTHIQTTPPCMHPRE
jgi:hypothetical protein